MLRSHSRNRSERSMADTTATALSGKVRPPLSRQRPAESESSTDQVEVGARPSSPSIRLLVKRNHKIKKERSPTSPLDLIRSLCEKQLRDCCEQKSEQLQHRASPP